jgi:hypothetical protein
LLLVGLDIYQKVGRQNTTRCSQAGLASETVANVSTYVFRSILGVGSFSNMIPNLVGGKMCDFHVFCLRQLSRMSLYESEKSSQAAYIVNQLT